MEESEIRIPSELIADEYLRKDNETGALYFFSDNNYKYFDDDSKRAFRICGFNIKKENQFLIDTKENVLNILDKITNENHKETSCFILLFFGTIGSNNDEYITESGDKIRGYEIWGKIMKCETLKYRPKIIIFQGFRVINTTQTDSSNSRKSLPIPTPPDYDIPYYSDMLITYKVTEGKDY
nr:caspase-6-like [Onthophagus taurus]